MITETMLHIKVAVVGWLPTRGSWGQLLV